MSVVRLSGKIEGAQDESRAFRAQMLYLLFANGWDIYNSNGDQRITLSNIEEKIEESDAFVFMPGASIEDLFKAVSIFVGYQTLDRNLFGKATVLLNSDKSWDPLFNLLDSLRENGTIQQNFRDFLLRVSTPEEALKSLERVAEEGLPSAEREKIMDCDAQSFDNPPEEELAARVCVFCSASIEDPSYLREGYELGRLLALNNYGCISGAGTTGAMGEVARGSVEGGGWTAGSNVPHIIELEGIPDGLSTFWLTEDIYTRMEVMIRNSDAFIIFPGGAGTVQEMLALLIFKEMDDPLMHGKPIIIYNRPIEGSETGFWQELIDLLHPWSEQQYFDVVDRIDALIPALRRVGLDDSG